MDLHAIWKADIRWQLSPCSGGRKFYQCQVQAVVRLHVLLRGCSFPGSEDLGSVAAPVAETPLYHVDGVRNLWLSLVEAPWILPLEPFQFLKQPNSLYYISLKNLEQFLFLAPNPDPHASSVHLWNLIRFWRMMWTLRINKKRDGSLLKPKKHCL